MILEKSISKIKGEAAGNLKFEMTGDMSKDREAHQLLIAQEEHLRKASELLTELYEAQEMSVMFMWIASIIAGIEATICAFTGMAWCAPTPVQNINAEPDKHYVLNKLLKLLPLKIEGAHAYDTSGKSSKDDYSFWYHLILQNSIKRWS